MALTEHCAIMLNRERSGLNADPFGTRVRKVSGPKVGQSLIYHAAARSLVWSQMRGFKINNFPRCSGVRV